MGQKQAKQHKTESQYLIIIVSTTKRRKYHFSVIEDGFILCQFKGVKDKYPLMLPSKRFSAHIHTHTRLLAHAQKQTRSLAAFNLAENRGGRGEEKMMSPL